MVFTVCYMWCQKLSFPLASLILSPLFSLGLVRDSLNRLIVPLATTPSYYTGDLLLWWYVWREGKHSIVL